MYSRLQDFVTRHRRKLIVTGVLVGGTFMAIKYAQRKLIEFQERQTLALLEKSRRMQHFESTERTCNQVILDMGAELCKAILAECSTNALLEQLRQNPPNKIVLWEEMKIVAFTRLTTLIYSSSMLVIALRVQLNLLGGYLYRNIKTEKKQLSDELQQQYLSLIRYFIHEGGLYELVRVIRSKVIAIMKPLPLTKQLSLAEMEQLFWSLQMSINSDNSGDPISRMSKFLMPPQAPEYSASVPLLEKMYNETLDLLESEDASTICSNSVCRGFSLAVDAIAESLGETVLLEQTTQAANKTSEETSEKYAKDPAQRQNNNFNMLSSTNTKPAVLNINSVQVALAKVIPIVSGVTSKGFDKNSRPQNLATSLLTFYMVSEKSKMLGANVYETFSSTQ